MFRIGETVRIKLDAGNDEFWWGGIPFQYLGEIGTVTHTDGDDVRLRFKNTMFYSKDSFFESKNLISLREEKLKRILK